MKKFAGLYIINTLLVTYCLAYPPAERSNYRQGRLSLVDWQGYSHTEPEGPGTYAFGYDIEEPENDNVQFRHEERHSNGSVTGSYGFVSPDGNVHIINYIADHLGYRASTETRYRGSVKPVKVNDEQDIQDAIEAAKTGKPVYSNRYQDYTNDNTLQEPYSNDENYEDKVNPNLILKNYRIFTERQRRLKRNIFFLHRHKLTQNSLS